MLIAILIVIVLATIIICRLLAHLHDKSVVAQALMYNEWAKTKQNPNYIPNKVTVTR